MSVVVIGGPASLDLGRKIAKRLDGKYVKSQLRVFPDGESKLTLRNVPKNGKIVVVQSTYPPVDSNLIHAFSLIAKAKLWSPQITAVIPYLGYMRQDMQFLKGEIVTSEMVARLLGAIGASKVITVDIHSKLALNYFTVPVRNVSAVPKLAAHLKKMRLQRPLVVAPDLFWSSRAKEFASILNTQSVALNKQRDRKTGRLHIKPSKKMNLLGRDVILLDDMISTGNSIIKAAEYLQNQNCGDIYAVCTHALLVNDAAKQIKEAGIKKIISANTIPNKTSIVDVSDVIANAI
jgi:ribose-phosphate pyrophosphokinase